MRSMEDRMRTMETTLVELRQIAHNQDRLNSKLDAAIERQEGTLYGHGDKPGLLSHVHGLREESSGRKKQIQTLWGALITAIVGGIMTLIGIKGQ